MKYYRWTRCFEAQRTDPAEGYTTMTLGRLEAGAPWDYESGEPLRGGAPTKAWLKSDGVHNDCLGNGPFVVSKALRDCLLSVISPDEAEFLPIPVRMEGSESPYGEFFFLNVLDNISGAINLDETPHSYESGGSLDIRTDDIILREGATEDRKIFRLKEYDYYLFVSEDVVKGVVQSGSDLP